MADLPDIYCWVKVLTVPSDKAIKEGEWINSPGKAVVRYVVANDSGLPAGPLMVFGTLSRNGVAVKPAGLPVVPAQTITVQPNQIWKKEYTVNESDPSVDYVAKLFGDVSFGGGAVVEEDETNNRGQRSFKFMTLPK
jgi:hypothetical protein